MLHPLNMVLMLVSGALMLILTVILMQKLIIILAMQMSQLEGLALMLVILVTTILLKVT